MTVRDLQNDVVGFGEEVYMTPAVKLQEAHLDRTFQNLIFYLVSLCATLSLGANLVSLVGVSLHEISNR